MTGSYVFTRKNISTGTIRLRGLLILAFYCCVLYSGAAYSAGSESDATVRTTAKRDQPSEFKLSQLYNPYFQNYVLFGADSETRGIDTNEEEKNVDIKFQISFISQINTGATRLENDIGRFSRSISGFLGPWFFGYTQESYWDIGKSSSPFRESNYRPEFFFRTPLSHKLSENANVFYGWIHESNGRDGDDSGGWDRLFIRYNQSFGRLFEKKNLTALNSLWNVDIRIWRILSRSQRNHDIRTFSGNAELTVNYQHENVCPFSSRVCSMGLTLRKGGDLDDTSHALVQLEHRFPITATGLNLVTQITSGYGHSIERFNQHESAVRVGFQFSDLFVPSP